MPRASPSVSPQPSGPFVEILLRDAGRLVTKRDLVREVWGPDHDEDGRATSSPSPAGATGSSHERSCAAAQACGPSVGDCWFARSASTRLLLADQLGRVLPWEVDMG
jgi:hypothetical protein